MHGNLERLSNVHHLPRTRNGFVRDCTGCNCREGFRGELDWHFQVDEVKNIMVDNIEKVLERGEKIELLVDKTDNLRFQVRQSGFPKELRHGAAFLEVIDSSQKALTRNHSLHLQHGLRCLTEFRVASLL